MDAPLNDKPINRLLSVVAPLVFALASFYAIGSLFASYFEKPYDILNGKVEEKYGLIRKIRTSNTESFLVVQKTNEATSKLPFYTNDTTYLTRKEIEKISNWKRTKEKEVDLSISKYSWDNLESLDLDVARLQEEPYQQIKDTLKVNNNISYVYSFQFYHIKQLGLQLNAGNKSFNFTGMELEDLQKLSLDDEKKVYFTNDYYPGWGIYYKFVAFSSIAALLHKVGYVWLVLFVFGILCLTGALYNFLRGGQTV